MKQAFLRFPGKKLVSVAFLSVSLLLTSVSSNATNHRSKIEILSGDKTSLQFVGSTDDALMFRIHINNVNSDEFTLTIKNESGDVLFSKAFNDTNFQKQFKLLKGDSDSGKYYFTIKSKNKEIEETYAIVASTRSVADVEIDKL